MCFPFSVILKNEGSTSKKCVNQIPNLLPTQDLKKGDLLGKGADAVVSIFLLPGNHKVCSRNDFNFKIILLQYQSCSGAENKNCERVRKSGLQRELPVWGL